MPPSSGISNLIGQSYGIFSGPKLYWAELRSSEERAPWVFRELWHPKQKITALKDERITLEMLFTDIRELSIDILRQGQHVEVLEPQELSDQVSKELKAALKKYANRGFTKKIEDRYQR
ncbi:MAG: WYL domain-containing protein [Rhodoferax sp.]|nr:WYL domain-containing protein [Rhodoferax sp.]